MSTKYYELTGTQKWGGKGLFLKDQEYGTYGLNLYPDEDSLKVIKEFKLPFKFKVDEDGTYGIIRRPHEKVIKGEVVVFGPPLVFWDTGEEWSPNTSLGNGSKVTCDVAVYDYTWQGKTKQAMRLNSVVVHKDGYVEYKKPQEGTPTAPTNARPF